MLKDLSKSINHQSINQFKGFKHAVKGQLSLQILSEISWIESLETALGLKELMKLVSTRFPLQLIMPKILFGFFFKLGKANNFKCAKPLN